MKTYLVLVIILTVKSYVTSVQFEDYDYDEESKYDHSYSSKSKSVHGENKPQSRKYESDEHSRNADPWKTSPPKSSYYEDDYDEESKYDHLYPAQSKEEIEEKKPIYKIEDAPHLFTKYIKDFNKSYKDKEDFDKHYENFVSSLKEINEINSSDATYTTDINMFSDLGPEELAIFTGGVPTQ